MRWFSALERRLDGNPEQKSAYSEFINEYYRLNHMREIDDDEPSPNFKTYYLPHHGVEKVDSTTTKLRVVFDASCETDSGISLNQALMVGPVVQDDLLAIILRFRMHRFVLVADIEKMYRQIRIHYSDYPLQRIIWRNSSSQPLKTFELTTVTYGTASAPYLATKCLQQLSKDGSKDFPLAATVLAKDFYVDDMLTGIDDEQTGELLCVQLLELLQSAGFSLRKWSSNSSVLLGKIPTELRDERTTLALDSNSTPIKTLGLQWHPINDQFSYFVPEWSKELTITRRIVLSDTARLYDPLGLIGPIVVIANIFIQSLWRKSKNWDDQLDVTQQQYWKDFRHSLNDLALIDIPRWVSSSSPTVTEIHGFCEASEKAYGACIFLRTVSSDGNIFVSLIAAKSKVAPLGDSKKQRRLSLPRLELSSAMLLSHLYHKVNISTSLNVKALFWTDSMITLH
ncbi:uncharacterized protein LOC129726433 [Wyeomyia smithii]|uniref:uncharacterized protein LOC129726433 n=1 Tax=Wyeomyia smithii TaxID=174621 RepID=UPI002467BE7F|nr:uncharacterized protein LOC129726433 [Wyeomyia smithii]